VDCTLCGIIPAVPSCNVVLNEVKGLRTAVREASFGVIKGICRRDLKVDKGILPLRRVRDVPNDIVKLANRTLAAPGLKLNDLGRNVA
jgi:hypothetical protein